MTQMKITRRDVILTGLAAPLVSTVAAKGKTMNPELFKVAATDDVLQRIRRRVADAHLPRTAQGSGWTFGVDAQWFASLLDYWRQEYDWRAQERVINAMPQFTTMFGGRRLHFVHQRSANPNAVPLLLLHGWPYSFWSFSEVMAPLAERFHVVVPSLPGCAFSQPIADAPRGLRAMSGPIHELMIGLGYRRYIAQGNDQGAVIADWLALDHADALLGEQTNLIAFRHKGAEYGSGHTGLAHPTAAEQRFVAEEQETYKQESAYFDLQRTRPETIAYAMTDSPVGLAAYLLDKWQKWTDTRQRSLEEIYGRDRLLTEVMLPLISDSFATSIWPYAGFALEPFSLDGRTIDVPFGFAGAPDPLNTPPPREFIAHSRTHIVQWDVAEHGGHFPFLEDPRRFVTEINRFADLLRS